MKIELSWKICSQIAWWKKVWSSHKKFKTSINHGLLLQKLHKVINFNEKVRLKLYINRKTEVRKTAKNDLEKISLTNEQCSFCKKHGKCKKT